MPTIDPTGSAPDHAVYEHLGFPDVADKLIKERSGEGSHREEIPGLRESAFWESTFLLHKASHVIGAAEFHADNGILTWSLSSAYHGGLFAAKAIMGLLGISIPEYNGRVIVVDFFPEPRKLSSRERKLRLEPEPEMEFYLAGKRFDHASIWQTFLRVIRVSKVEVWDDEVIGYFRNLNVSAFAHQRNRIHYWNHFWLLNDLHNRLADDNFGLDTNRLTTKSFSNSDEADFSLLVCQILLRLGYLLLNDVGSYSKKVKKELALFSGNLNDVKHPKYNRNYTASHPGPE